jgi:citrate lyase subunit beta/citryl-CoA lyase
LVDGSHLELKEAQTCERACRQGRELGFEGKCVIHPVQLPYTTDAFTPRARELERARTIIRTMEEAQAASRPYAVLEGRLLQPVELEAARALLAFHQQIQAREAAFHNARPYAGAE